MMKIKLTKLDMALARNKIYLDMLLQCFPYVEGELKLDIKRELERAEAENNYHD